jgi:tetratricopeptide (TPR) repeat protein
MLIGAIPLAILASRPAIGAAAFDPGGVKDLYKHCVGVAEETRRKIPDLVKPIFDLGKVHRRFGLDDNAVACYREGLRLDPRHPEILSEIAFIYSQRINEPAILQEALAACHKALEIAPGYPGVQTRIGMILTHVGGRQRIEESVKAFRAEIENRTADTFTYIMLGKALKDLEMLPEAVIAFREAHRMSPEDTGPLYQLAQVYKAMGQTAEKEEAIRLRRLELQAIEKFTELKKEEQAREVMKKGDNRENQLSWASQTYLDAAETYMAKDLLPEAIFALRAALACQPTVHPIRKILVDAYRKSGAIEEALSECRTAAANDRSPDLLYLFAGLCTERKRYAEAASLLQEVITSAPDQSEAYRELARLILSGHVPGTPERALELAMQAIAKPPSGGAPELAYCYSVLSWAFDRSGNTESAIAALTTAANLDPANPDHQEKLYRLKKRGR